MLKVQPCHSDVSQNQVQIKKMLNLVQHDSCYLEQRSTFLDQTRHRINMVNFK